MNNKILVTAISFYIFLTASTMASLSISNTNQVEQDKARQSALAPAQQEYQSSGTGSRKYQLVFPLEATCRYINHVEILSADDKLTRSLLGNIALQAEKSVWVLKAYVYSPQHCKMNSLPGDISLPLLMFLPNL